MKISHAEFWAAAATREAIPAARHPEVAVAGRSNVGKSSLLNKLAARRRLARTSRTPGCTRGLIFYAVECGGERISLVDLPGYGYASRSKAERQNWQRLVESYLKSREELAGLLILVDARRGAEQEERDLANFLEANAIAYAWVLTKTDKLARSKLSAALSSLRESLGPAAVVATSSKTGAGVDLVWKWIRAAVADELTPDSEGDASLV